MDILGKEQKPQTNVMLTLGAQRSSDIVIQATLLNSDKIINKLAERRETSGIKLPHLCWKESCLRSGFLMKDKNGSFLFMKLDTTILY